MSDQTKLQHFIGGERVPPASGEYFESTNPATREVPSGCAKVNAIPSCSWSRKPYAPLVW